MLGHIVVTDVNDALPKALPMLRAHGLTHTAASVANAKATVEWPGLFVTEYVRPQRCVLFDPVRDANPFFHFLESMWILAGRNDVAYLQHILPRMAEYSDDGETFHGAYGHRLRHATGRPFGPGMFEDVDQLETCIGLLRKSPASRQVVASIWDPASDLGVTTKDMPCNDLLMFKLRNNKLDLTVCNRSNDAVWGCYGANVVQFSMLLMYMAARIGCGVGTYYQMSNSFHVYEDNAYWQWFTAQYAKDPDHWHKPLHGSRCKYGMLDAVANPFEQGIDLFDMELRTFFNEADEIIAKGGGPFGWTTDTPVVRTAVNMWNALYWHRAKNRDKAWQCASEIELPDWQCAAREWLERRTK